MIRAFLFIFLLLRATMFASLPTLLRLNADGNSMHSETALYFDAGGSFVYNAATDAPSLGADSGYLDITSRFNGIDFQIKCLPSLSQNISIPLKIITGLTGTYQVSAGDIQNLPSGACITLHDNFTNSDLDLRAGNYTCTISDTESVARFLLNIQITVISVTGGFLDPTCASSGDGYLFAGVPNSTTSWNYYWKDSLNNIIAVSTKNSNDTLFGIHSGAYRVDITSAGTCVNGSVSFYVEGTLSPDAYYTIPVDTTDLFTGESFTNTSLNANNYYWDFGDGMSSNSKDPLHYYSAQGTYTVTLIAIGAACPDSSFYSKEITVIAEATSDKQTNEENRNMFIDKDTEGYYLKLNSRSKQDIIISVTNLAGQKLTTDVEAKNVSCEKIRVPLPDHEHGIIILSAVSMSGNKVYKKVID